MARRAEGGALGKANEMFWQRKSKKGGKGKSVRISVAGVAKCSGVGCGEKIDGLSIEVHPTHLHDVPQTPSRNWDAQAGGFGREEAKEGLGEEVFFCE